jgi:hypothetical protein
VPEATKVKPTTPASAGTAHEDFGVRVERDLSGSGRLARGDSTHYSKLNFRSIGRPAPSASEGVTGEAEVAGAAATPTAVAPTAIPAPSEPPAEGMPDSKAPGLLGKVANFLGL